MVRIILNLILITSSFSVFGQGDIGAPKALLDSLTQELRFIHDDSLKVEMLLQIADSYSDRNPDTTIYYAQEALQLAKQIKNIPAQMGAMSFIGEAFIYKGNLPEALRLGLEAIEMGKDHPVRVSGGVGPNYGNLGSLYLQIGNYDKAMQYFKKMILMGDYDNIGVAYGYYYLAEVYEKTDQLDSANISLQKSYKKFSAINYSYYPKIYDVYPPWYNLRAKIYLKQNKPELALKDLFSSLSMTLRTGEISHLSNTYIDISNYYEKFNQIDSSIYYAEKAFREANKISYTKGILGASEILAKQFERTDPVKALNYYKLASETRNKLYGAGNIQIMRDMIDQEEKKQAEIEAAKIAYQNRLKMNAILGITFTLFGFAIFLFIIIRRKQKAKQKIESAYELLRSTQKQLIQSEKMASLGELTAGIAHEIQNPLNFVNNFSEVSIELVDELQEELNMNNPDVAREISNDIKQNLGKIHHHGKRAEGIVKGMLQHSRTSQGEKEPTDINALADEYLRLAYHGLRAKDKSFTADFKTDFDKSLPKVNVVPQDMGRVLLNLINNAFYAVSSKALATEDGDYKPLITVSTKHIPLSEGAQGEEKIEISVKDNGPGISEQVRDKIFQPFFTTKPTGQGTGLGLSLSYDIITKGHNGHLAVETTEGTGSKFIIEIPLTP
jgi:two-component system NtrC family sensor kinase